MKKRPLLPAGWIKPKGYANGVAASGTQVFIAGQIGWNEAARMTTDQFAGQAIQALRNVLAVLREAGGRPEHLVRMTWYVTDKREYLASLKEIGQAFRELIGEDRLPLRVYVMLDGAIRPRSRNGSRVGRRSIHATN